MPKILPDLCSELSAVWMGSHSPQETVGSPKLINGDVGKSINPDAPISKKTDTDFATRIPTATALGSFPITHNPQPLDVSIIL